MKLHRLDLVTVDRAFDEALLMINGHEKKTITIEAEGSVDIAEELAKLINNRHAIIATLEAAAHALRSYEFGNNAPDLARDIAAHCDAVKAGMAA